MEDQEVIRNKSIEKKAPNKNGKFIRKQENKNHTTLKRLQLEDEDIQVVKVLRLSNKNSSDPIEHIDLIDSDEDECENWKESLIIEEDPLALDSSLQSSSEIEKGCEIVNDIEVSATPMLYNYITTANKLPQVGEKVEAGYYLKPEQLAVIPRTTFDNKHCEKSSLPSKKPISDIRPKPEKYALPTKKPISDIRPRPAVQVKKLRTSSKPKNIYTHVRKKTCIKCGDQFSTVAELFAHIDTHAVGKLFFVDNKKNYGLMY